MHKVGFLRTGSNDICDDSFLFSLFLSLCMFSYTRQGQYFCLLCVAFVCFFLHKTSYVYTKPLMFTQNLKCKLNAVSWASFIFEPSQEKTNNLHMQKQTQISFAKLISVFVFTTWIVQFFFFPNSKFPASSLFL